MYFRYFVIQWWYPSVFTYYLLLDTSGVKMTNGTKGRTEVSEHDDPCRWLPLASNAQHGPLITTSIQTWPVGCLSWCYHDMGTIYSVLSICTRNHDVTGGFPVIKLIHRFAGYCIVMNDNIYNKLLSKMGRVNVHIMSTNEFAKKNNVHCTCAFVILLYVAEQ